MNSFTLFARIYSLVHVGACVMLGHLQEYAPFSIFMSDGFNFSGGKTFWFAYRKASNDPIILMIISSSVAFGCTKLG